MSLDAVIFFVSALVAVFGATMMIAQRNPVASVLYLILSLAAQSVLYIQLAALFMGIVLIVVYAGAIMVLFLFVIMLLNLRGTEDLGEKPPPVSLATKYIVGILILVELLFVIQSLQLPLEKAATGVMSLEPGSFGAVADVARTMFTKYLYPIELTGVLLTVAVIGAVALAKRDRDEKPTGDAETSVTGSESGKVGE